MTRYVVAIENDIIQILQSKPLFVPDGAVIHEYNGIASDDMLIIENNKVKSKLVGDEPEAVPAPPIPFDLELYKKAKIKYIEQQINNVRVSFSSEMLGQLEVYWEKVQESIDYIAAGSPLNTESFPFISVEMEISGQTGQQVAIEILQKKKHWIMVAAKTERIRKVAKLQIMKCVTIDEVNNTVSSTLSDINLCKTI